MLVGSVMTKLKMAMSACSGGWKISVKKLGGMAPTVSFAAILTCSLLHAEVGRVRCGESQRLISHLRKWEILS